MGITQHFHLLLQCTCYQALLNSEDLAQGAGLFLFLVLFLIPQASRFTFLPMNGVGMLSHGKLRSIRGAICVSLSELQVPYPLSSLHCHSAK